MKAQSQRCFPAATCAPSCSFMHSSSWAREPDHKDALLLFWLQLTSPWFLSSSFWASCCLSPKSQNWSALSHSNWDWTRDMCFIEGKPTHCAYMIFNAIYRGTHVSKYTGTCMFLLFALFAFSSPLIDRDRFFPYNYFLLCSFFFFMLKWPSANAITGFRIPTCACPSFITASQGRFSSSLYTAHTKVYPFNITSLSSTFPFLTAACPNNHALVNSFPAKTSEQIPCSQDSIFTNSLYLLVIVHIRLQVTWNKTEESIHTCTGMLQILRYAKSRNSSFIAQGSSDHEIKQYHHSLRLLCRFSSSGVWYMLRSCSYSPPKPDLMYTLSLLKNSKPSLVDSTSQTSPSGPVEFNCIMLRPPTC